MMGIRERLSKPSELRTWVNPLAALSEAERISMRGQYAIREDTDISLTYDRTRQMDPVGLRRWRR